MHYSVGALIKKDGKYLLIDRVQPPFGFAGIAGHIDEGENPEQALKREVEEESGLKIEKYKLLFEEELDWNWCSKGVGIHYWYLYECDVSGKIKENYTETKSIGWYSAEEIKKLKLEPVWEYWFKKIKII
jgi:8-oxo-dGTP pyrophosphatase MutT (NUDIX family)